MTHIGSLLPLPLLSLVLLSASALDSSVYTYRDIFTRGFRTAVHNPQAHDYVKQVHEHNPQVYNNYVTQVHDHNSQVQGRDSIVYDHNHQVLEHNPQVYDYFTQGYDRNPQVQERDSVVYDHNPQVIELNPPVHDHNPQVHDHNPQVHDHNPQVLEHKPQVHDHNPRIHDHNPLVYDHNPQVHDHNPQVGAHNPQVHIHDKNPRSENDQSVFNIPLDPAGLAEMFWSLDYLNKEVAIEVHAYLKPTQWMAVGFSDYGKLSHADLCVYWIDWKRKARMQDANSDKDCKLMEDEHQDCKNFRVMKQGNITKFMFVRKFDTCDNQDYVIEEGTTHIVFSIGDGPLFSINGVNIAATKHNGMQRTQLLKNINAHVPLPKSAWSFDVVANKVKVPNAETTYWCHIVELSSKLKKRHHVVQFESVIQKGNEPLVHHIEVFQCVADPDKVIPHYSGPCTGPNRPNATQVCKKVIAAWAMGATPFSYPKEAGLPIGGSDFNRFVMLEVHYNNPNKKDDYVDSSGVRVHVTDELRENDAGVIELGLEYIDKMAIPPRQKVFPLSGYCIAECTGISLPPEGIVIFGSQLHTHLTGVRVFTKHVRDGKELKELNRDNHYSTHFQEIRVLKEPRTLLPGDALITTCWYNTEDRANITVGGFAISDEMCVNYIYYYPKLNLEVCKSSISDENLINYFKLMNELESQPTSPKLGITDNYKSIEWNPIRVRVLDELYHQSPIYMQCNQSSGLRFPGDWSRVPLTRISQHLPIPERDCA